MGSVETLLLQFRSQLDFAGGWPGQSPVAFAFKITTDLAGAPTKLQVGLPHSSQNPIWVPRSSPALARAGPSRPQVSRITDSPLRPTILMVCLAD